MSDNSVILLDLKKFELTHSDIENEKSEGYFFIRKYKTLKAVLKAAKKLQDERMPEYGITIINI